MFASPSSSLPGSGASTTSTPFDEKRKRVRFDAGAATDRRPEPGQGSLLKAFGAWGTRGAVKSVIRGLTLVSPSPDRRAEARHHHVECLAWVGWKTWRRFHMNDTLVINLSRGGAKLFLDAPPPPRRPVWVYLETPEQRGVVKARVLEVQATRGGQYVVRVAFTEPCPYSFFEAAVCGLAPSNPRLRLTPNAPRVTGPRPAAASAEPAKKAAVG